MLAVKKENKKAVIWGAGTYGKNVLEMIAVLGKNQLEIVGFIDMNKKGWYLGHPIIQDKDHALEVCDTVFVAVADECARLEIMDYLEQRGKERNRDYFLAVNEPIRI